MYYLGTDPTAVPVLLKAQDDIKVLPIENGIRIFSSATCEIPVYGVNGILLKKINVSEGEQDVCLPQGQFIVNGKVVIVRN